MFYFERARRDHLSGRRQKCRYLLPFSKPINLATMIKLVRKLYRRIIFDTFLDLLSISRLSERENEGIRNFQRWQRGDLEVHDDTLLDSNRRFLLLTSGDRVFLVHRSDSWRGELDEWSLDLYAAKGQRSFAKIRRHLGRRREG